MKKYILFLLCTIFLIGIINAEVTLWGTVIVDNNASIVKQHVYYQFDDTSSDNLGKPKPIVLHMYPHVEALPFDLTPYGYWGEVDWCNFSAMQRADVYSFIPYSGTWEVTNTTTYFNSIYYDVSSSPDLKFDIDLRGNDILIVDMSCHYTDNRSLYAGNVLVGSFTTFMPSYECSDCTQYSLEQQSQMTEYNENIALNEVSIYDMVQTVVDWNYQLWLIASWVLKIGFVFVAIGLIFAVGYYFYKFLIKLRSDM